MKRIRVVQVVGIVLFVAYLLLFIADMLRNVLGNYKEIILSVLISLIGVNLLVKGFLIKSNSTLWFANVLILMSLTIALLEFLKFDIVNYYYLFTIIPMIASVINLIVFKNLIYIKVMIINFTVIVPTVLQFIYKFDIYLMTLMFVISILIGILICRMINFDRENV